ncbi:WS/DGAT/MGAT family O-acyltransferase [Dactylosporangium sp. CA-139066]|uniref:WS/DGAT/MGAT family O-acyltransferase n=1 Tax=Dactylosporangium sp. CA-139066 TaxID=3239930 RepID=UPI003D89FC6A
MRQLSALDAQFLSLETDAGVANIGGLSVLDGECSRNDLVALVGERSALVAPLRQRIMPVPFGLDRPYWVEAEAVDLGYHVRETRLPHPGSDRQLAAQVARLHGRRLDRRRPLWEMYLIHGLRGGRSAVYVKLHHATVDGVGGAQILAAVLDREPRPPRRAPAPPAAPDYAPGSAEVLVRAGARLVAGPVRLVRCLLETVPYLDEIPLVSRLPGAARVSGTIRSATRCLAKGEQVPVLPRLTAPRTPFNGPVSSRRSFAFTTLRLDEVKWIKNAFGVTVNDVVMTLTAAAVRRWLLDRGALPEEPLVTAVPFSLREADGAGAGNQVTLMITSLPTQIADPRERLQAVHAAMRRIKDRRKLAPAPWLQTWSEGMPTALTGLGDRAAFSLIAHTSPVINLVVSNVPGPQHPLYLCGRRVLAMYPVSAVTDASGGLGITALSYDGGIAIGIIADPTMVPNIWHLAGYLREASQELKSCARAGLRRAPV